MTLKEELITERYNWKNKILEKFNEQKWYDVLYLMALNRGEHGDIEAMIKTHCENTDPVKNWQQYA